MQESAMVFNRASPAIDIWLRFSIANRRLRFAALLSRISGLPLEEAWRAFRPLPSPEHESRSTERWDRRL